MSSVTAVRSKVLHGQPDRRRKEFRVEHQAESKQLDTCNRFLQLRYHADAEFLPDRFEFEQLRGRPALVCCPPVRRQTPDTTYESESEDEDARANADLDEEDLRSLNSLAVKAVVACNPFDNAMTGPQMADAPRRYLGVIKPAVMYELCRAWCHQNQLLTPSWTTFRRALRAASKWLSFRKAAGQHGLCDQCMHYKRELRKQLPVRLRTQCMEDYASHLLRNWRDRQVDAAWHAQAGQTRQAMMSGIPLGELQHSVLLLRSDGLDQAKHRVPRVLVHSKMFDTVIRPAMHCQMIWCHFHLFEFCISEPDVRKDSTVHMDALSRCLSTIFDQHRALPRHVYVVLDNTSRDNKNQHMLKYWIKLRLLSVFESIYIAFPIKGHTHGPLDGIGGHAVAA